MFSAVSSLISNLKTKLKTKNNVKKSSVRALSVEQPKHVEHTTSQSISKTLASSVSDFSEKSEIKPAKYAKLVTVKVEACPNCSNYTNDKTMHKYVIVEGPIFLRKDLAKENLRSFVKIGDVLKCSRCGYEKVRKKIFIPIETVDLLEPLLCNDVVNVIGKIRNVGLKIEEVLAKFLG